MLSIRQCDNCDQRVRSIGWVALRGSRCPYCKAVSSETSETQPPIAPTKREWAVWILGFFTEIVGVLLPVVILLGHERFSMSWLGASLVAAILIFLLVTTGRKARVGSVDESIGWNIVALVLLYGLAVYGAVAFPALDALGGSFMVLLAVFCIIGTNDFEMGTVMREKADRAQFWSWVLLLGFLAAYVYHAVQPLLKR